LLAAVACAALVLSRIRASAVDRRLAIVAPLRTLGSPRRRVMSDIDVRHAAIGIGHDRIIALKVAAAGAGALIAALVGLAVPVGPAVVLAGAYAGFVLPSVWVEGRARGRRREAERAVTVLVERIDALVSAGRPPETALALLMTRPSGSALLDAVLRQASDAYALGAPIFRTLAAHARDEGLIACATVADELERARDLGIGSLAIIHERRNALRAGERARSLEAASQVEGKLMLVLVLCYLPALILLVVLPLFIGLLEGLFA
jgi:pilus assembly protein TadC